MPANEFEKQVQNLMEEMKVSPSEAVWPKVEERIREKKRRRRLIIFPLLFGVALLGYLGTTYFLSRNKNSIAAENVKQKNSQSIIYNNDTKEPELKQKELTAKQNVQQPEKKESVQLKTTAAENGPQVQVKKAINEATNKTNPPITKNFFNPGVIKIKKEKNDNIKITPASKSYSERQKTAVAPGSNKKEGSTAEPVISEPRTNINETEKNNLPVKNTAEPVSADTVKKVVAIKNPESTNDSTKQAEVVANVNPVQKKEANKKITWGFHFSAGVSSMNDNLILLNKSENRDVYSSIIGGSTGQGNPSYSPSAPKSGFAFQSGPVMEKKISKRSSLSVALLYSYYSNHIKVGEKNDSVLSLTNSSFNLQKADDAYQGRPVNNFTNKYHFIELPLQYNLQLNKGKKVPINWQAGIFFSRLVASNALVYDAANGGIYYDNNPFLNKNNIGVSSGFLFGFNMGNNMRLNAGPYIGFNFSNLYKSEYNKNLYVLYTGLKINLLFTDKF